MKQEFPQVSIIMATYNRAHYITESLNSISNSTFTNWECFIIDDGGNDNTFEVAGNFTKNDKRFKFYTRSEKYKKGLPGCRNYGLDLAPGKYIVFFDDDDIVHPLLIELCVKEMEKQPIDYCRYLRTVFTEEFHYKFNMVGEYNIKPISILNIEEVVTGKIPFNSCQILWDRSCFEGNRFHEELMYAEEWELYTRILAEGKKGISIEKILFFGRKHPISNTGEFYKKNPIRIRSKILSTLLVINNLSSKNLLTKPLKKHFIRLGFQLKSYPIIREVLQNTNEDKLKMYQYRLVFLFYPVIRPFFKLKGRLKST